VLLGDERDSPRGRIYFIKAMLEGDRAPSESEVRHIDRCLSCLSCMTTCPSGVNYMHLVDHGRHHIETRYTRSLSDRLLRGVQILLRQSARTPARDRVQQLLSILRSDGDELAGRSGNGHGSGASSHINGELNVGNRFNTVLTRHGALNNSSQARRLRRGLRQDIGTRQSNQQHDRKQLHWSSHPLVHRGPASVLA